MTPVPHARSHFWRKMRSGADIGRLHALHDRVPDQLGADCLADDGSRAIAPNEIAAVRAPGRAGFEVPQDDACRTVFNADVFDERAVDDADARLCRGMLEQDGLEEADAGDPKIADHQERRQPALRP